MVRQTCLNIRDVCICSLKFANVFISKDKNFGVSAVDLSLKLTLCLFKFFSLLLD